MASNEKTRSTELKPVGYELFIGALSVLSIFNLILLLFVRDQSLETVIYVINAFMMPIFLADFLYRFFTTESKSSWTPRNRRRPTYAPNWKISTSSFELID